MNAKVKNRPFSFSVLVRDQLIPKLEKGAEGAEIELTTDDCQRLLFFLRTSVPLEPFLETFVELIHTTVAQETGEEKDKNEM